jgi:hypothetical protein
LCFCKWMDSKILARFGGFHSLQMCNCDWWVSDTVTDQDHLIIVEHPITWDVLSRCYLFMDRKSEPGASLSSWLQIKLKACCHIWMNARKFVSLTFEIELKIWISYLEWVMFWYRLAFLEHWLIHSSLDRMERQVMPARFICMFENFETWHLFHVLSHWVLSIRL